MTNRIYVTAAIAGGEPHLIFSGDGFQRQEVKALFHALYGAHADGEFNLSPTTDLKLGLIHEGAWLNRGDLDDGGVLRLAGEWTLTEESFQRWGAQHLQPALPVDPLEYLSSENYWLYPIFEAAKRFGAEIVRRRAEADAAREGDRNKQPVTETSPAELTGEAKALALLVQYPEWTDTKIAKAVPCNRTTLYDWPKYMAAREALSQGRRQKPRGSKDKDGNLEAWQ